MTLESMTIHEALCELKLLDKRIEDKIGKATFCYNHKKSVVKPGGKSVEDRNNEIRADWQSIDSLLRRRRAIRNAVARSNGTTMVTINGQEYTVSEAIEMRDRGISLHDMLLFAANSQFDRTTKEAARVNDDLDESATDYVVRLFGNKDKAAVGDTEAAKKMYMEANTMVTEDPLGLKTKMDELRESIDAFKKEVNSRLSVSNALTVIEISY